MRIKRTAIITTSRGNSILGLNLGESGKGVSQFHITLGVTGRMNLPTHCPFSFSITVWTVPETSPGLLLFLSLPVKALSSTAFLCFPGEGDVVDVTKEHSAFACATLLVQVTVVVTLSLHCSKLIIGAKVLVGAQR